MKRINLLLRAYFQETEEEGLQVLRRLLAWADRVDLTTIIGPKKLRHSGASDQIRLAESFNVIEGVLTSSSTTDLTTDAELDIRYRPGLRSRVWRKLEAPNLSTSIPSEDSEALQFLLSLIGFEKSASVSGLENTAVLELLCCSILMEDTPEKTIATSLKQLCPELLTTALWGYADAVPFRQLSVEQEWQVARTDVLWADLSVTAGAQHEYLFRTQGAESSVTIPNAGVSEGVLTIYKT